MSEIVAFLTKCLREDKAIAERARKAGARSWWARNVPRFDHGYPRWQVDLVLPERASPRGAADCFDEATAKHVARHDPDHVLREIAGKRAILAEVASWRHNYVDGDSWLSCAQAVDEHDEEQTPGSGCADESRAGGPCECNLERRREAILRPLALAYSDRPGYQERWKP